MPTKRTPKVAVKKVEKKPTPLPIPLTCGGPYVNSEGRCSQGLENGACIMPEQFMCPIFLRYEIENPGKVGDVPQELVEKFRNEKPCRL